MSLILEALRKSEAERRRGQAPDLLTETAPPIPNAGVVARDWRVIGVVAGAALVAVLLTIAWLRSSATPESVATSDSRAALEPATASPQGPLQPPQPPALPSRTTVAPAPTAPPLAAAAPPPAPRVVDQPPRAPDIDIAPPPSAALPASPTTPPVSAPSNPPAATFASPDVPLRLSDLSTEERQQLPALKVSMHMWAPDAGNRFAIIDGTRVNEGDRVGDATVEAIQQDAVMLAWRGRRIRLPIR